MATYPHSNSNHVGNRSQQSAGTSCSSEFHISDLGKFLLSFRCHNNEIGILFSSYCCLLSRRAAAAAALYGVQNWFCCFMPLPTPHRRCAGRSVQRCCYSNPFGIWSIRLSCCCLQSLSLPLCHCHQHHSVSRRFDCEKSNSADRRDGMWSECFVFCQVHSCLIE